MVADLKPILPQIFPQETIRVTDESHIYQTFEGDSGSILETREYTLDKAPVDEITEVTGIVDGKTYTFNNGTDYILSTDRERIVWLDDPAERPDAGTEFDVTYHCNSILNRYLSSSKEEIEIVDNDLEDVIESKFIDKATGKDLDRLGETFGELGKRRGRNDQQYRIYLKSAVNSFISRGTKNGIKLAVSTATEVPIKDITINEDFETNEYEIVVIANTPVRGSVLEFIAEIADPSGIKLKSTRYTIDIDVVGVNDGDVTFRKVPKASVSDQLTSSDAFISTQINKITWNTDNWNQMNWAVEHN